MVVMKVQRVSGIRLTVRDSTLKIVRSGRRGAAGAAMKRNEELQLTKRQRTKTSKEYHYRTLLSPCGTFDTRYPINQPSIPFLLVFIPHTTRTISTRKHV